jgi:vitamin B12 transporter
MVLHRESMSKPGYRPVLHGKQKPIHTGSTYYLIHMYSGGVHLRKTHKTMRTYFIRSAVTAAIVSSLSTPVFSQSTSNDIETLTVTGSRLPIQLTQFPGSVSVITQADIQASGALQLTELIRGLPGVSLSQSGSPGGLTEVRVRGSESNHLLVLIDGVVANDVGQGSLIDLAHLTTSNVVRIELLRGPQSARWGSGAIGGVLSITTKASQSNVSSPVVSLTAGAGTQGTYQGGINAAAQEGNLRVGAYANYVTTDGDNIARSGSEDDGYDNLTAGLNLTYNANKEHALSAQLRTVDYENDYDGTDFVNTGLPADSDNVTDGFQLSTRLRWDYTPSTSSYRSALTAQYRKDENDNTTSGVDAGGTTGERLELNWTNFYSVDNWQLAGGVEYLQRLFEQRGPIGFGDPNQKQHDNTHSIFAEANGELSDNVFAAMSARIDDNSEFDDATSYRAGLTWQVHKNYALFTSFGRAVKTPTFTERFGFFPASFIGNENLEPETSEEFELGVKANWQTFSGQISIYSAQLEDEINGFVFVPDLGTFSADNVDGESERDGVDLELNWQTSYGNFAASYSYLDAQQTNADITTRELRRAQHQGALVFTSNLGTDKFTLYTKLAYTGTRFDTFFPPFPQPAQTLALSAYTLATINLSYQIDEKWQAALKVNNAFDTDYEDIVGFAGQERRALFTVHYTM